jgi:lipopolysaccharide export system protein LptA
MTIIKSYLSLALGSLCLLLAVDAYAERADRLRKVIVQGDDVLFDQAKGFAVLEGNALVEQGSLRLTAGKMTVKEDPAGNKAVQAFGTATKPITFRQKREGSEGYWEGHAQRADFDEKTGVVKFLANARLNSGGDEITSEYIEYNSLTEVVKLRNAIPNADGSSGAPSNNQPTIISQPKISPDAAATAPKKN